MIFHIIMTLGVSIFTSQGNTKYYHSILKLNVSLAFLYYLTNCPKWLSSKFILVSEYVHICSKQNQRELISYLNKQVMFTQLSGKTRPAF